MTQFIIVLPPAPPPEAAVLLASRQLFSVPEDTPPPQARAEFPMITQLEIVELVDSHHTPPPSKLIDEPFPPSSLVAPFVTVNPTSAALFVKYTQRTALLPFVTPST